MKFRLALILGFVLLGQTAGRANFISYSQWEARDQEWRAAYITGAVDSLLSYVTDDRGRFASEHYDHCLQRTRMTAGQLSENLRSYVSANPKLQAETVQIALLQYLGALCGWPAKQAQ